MELSKIFKKNTWFVSMTEEQRRVGLGFLTDMVAQYENSLVKARHAQKSIVSLPCINEDQRAVLAGCNHHVHNIYEYYMKKADEAWNVLSSYPEMKERAFEIVEEQKALGLRLERRF